jgi:hypothetical protein
MAAAIAFVLCVIFYIVFIIFYIYLATYFGNYFYGITTFIIAIVIIMLIFCWDEPDYHHHHTKVAICTTKDLPDRSIHFQTACDKATFINFTAHTQCKNRGLIKVTLDASECAAGSEFDCSISGVSETFNITLPSSEDNLTQSKSGDPFELLEWTSPEKGTSLRVSYIIPSKNIQIRVVAPPGIVMTGRITAENLHGTELSGLSQTRS